MAAAERLRTHQATSEQTVALLLAMRELTLRGRIEQAHSVETGALVSSLAIRSHALADDVVAGLGDILVDSASAYDDVLPFARRQRCKADLVPFAVDQVQLRDVIDDAPARIGLGSIRACVSPIALAPAAVVLIDAQKSRTRVDVQLLRQVFDAP